MPVSFDSVVSVTSASAAHDANHEGPTPFVQSGIATAFTAQPLNVDSSIVAGSEDASNLTADSDTQSRKQSFPMEYTLDGIATSRSPEGRSSAPRGGRAACPWRT
jgi:hypothetical protein